MLCWGLFSTLPTNHTPAFVFFLKEKTKEKWKWCPPPLPAPMCLGFPLFPFSTHPLMCVSTVTLPLSRKTNV